MKRLAEALVTPGLLLVAVFGVAYGFYNRYLVIPPNLAGGQVQHVYMDSTSPQFMAFVVVTFWTMACLQVLPEITAAPHAIRLGSFASVARALVSDMTIRYTAGFVVLLACWFATSLGAQATPSQVQEAVVLFAALSLLGQVILVGATLLVGSLVIVTVRLATGSRLAALLTAGGIWAWSLVSSLGLIPAESPANSGPYLNFESFLESRSRAVAAVLTLVLVCATCFATLAFKDRRTFWQRKVGLGPTALVAIAGVCVILSVDQAGPEANLGIVLARVLGGREGNLLQFLTSVVIMIGFLFVLQLRIAQSVDRGAVYELIRYGSTWKWVRVKFGWVPLAALAYLLLVALIAVVALLISPHGPWTRAFEVSPVNLYQLAVNGSLQLCLYSGVTFVAMWMIGHSMTGLLADAALIVVIFLQAPARAFVPIGLATPTVSNGWSFPLSATLSLAVAMVVVAAISAALFARRPLGFQEA